MEASELEAEVELELSVRRGFEKAIELGAKCRSLYVAWEKEDPTPPTLPDFLAGYTPLWALARGVWRSVEAHQRLKRFDEAVDALRWLLAGPCCPKYRGLWFERLAINCSHLKLFDEVDAIPIQLHRAEPSLGDGFGEFGLISGFSSSSQEFDAAEQGIRDSRVRPHHKLALLERAERLCTGTGRRGRAKSSADWDRRLAAMRTERGEVPELTGVPRIAEIPEVGGRRGDVGVARRQA